MRRLVLSLLALSIVICGPVMAEDVEARNKAVARSFFEDVLDKGKLEDYAKSHAPDFVANSEGRKASLEEDMAAAREQRKALPDMRVQVNNIVAEGDLVSVYWTASGTNTAAGSGNPCDGQERQRPRHDAVSLRARPDSGRVERVQHVLDHEAARVATAAPRVARVHTARAAAFRPRARPARSR